jgi:peptidoglycan L-alanyl-D-glutamate endopeptidase CwlK
MINSRDIADLHPAVREKARAFIAACDTAGIDLLITSTYRDFDSQGALYAQGRTTSGKVVTNAKPGHSWHNWRLAFDVVPLRAGKPVWSTTGADGAMWAQVGAIGESCGLEWAGRWQRFREMAHFQYSGGLTIADLLAGKRLENIA